MNLPLTPKRTSTVPADEAGPYDPSQGIEGPIDQWCQFNLKTASDQDRKYLAPFPPPALMLDTSALTENKDFAAHGVALLQALTRASPIPLAAAGSILDFGIGVGRLARMFKGFRGRYVGVDIDNRNIDWLNKAMPEIEAVRTVPHAPLPFADGTFEVVIGLSVFTHLNRADHLFYLDELRRVVRPGGYVLLSVHGERALARAATEDRIFRMLSIKHSDIEQARASYNRHDGFHFVRQPGHLSTAKYDYGMTFISAEYVERVWSGFFDVLDIKTGAIHNFQDLVVMQKRTL